jgi:glutamyl-Q tRNA(Asp) synthetase
VALNAKTRPCRGRFAPTPSGPLHLGSLFTALGSYLHAKAQGGAWLLRIDDLDRPRCPRGMDDVILRQLEAHALYWDGPVRYQSAHVDEYRSALADLAAQGRTYACSCTRATLQQNSRPGPDDLVYDGRCRERAAVGSRAALRVRVPEGAICFDDLWLGRQCRDFQHDLGDFVVRRNDGEIAYQLACVVDECAQGITEVVRGADLLGSSFRQQHLQGVLAFSVPRYGHLPVLADARGRKLSKQNHAAPVEAKCAAANLVDCLRRLGQPVPQREGSPEEIIAAATRSWGAANVCGAAQPAVALAYNALQQTPDPLP